MTLALLMIVFLLTGCKSQKTETRYQATLMDLFDTVTSIIGYAESEQAFLETVQQIRTEMEEYDHLYDIYHEYPNLINLCTVNNQPGVVHTVDQRIIDLLVFAREVDAFSGHRTDVMIGSVLSLWHAARETGITDPDHAQLPDETALQEAMTHSGFDCLFLDEESRTVCITDSGAKLDVGALAKGYAVQRIAEKLPEGLLLSVGGTVVATGPKPDGSSWVVGIQDPDGGAEGYLHKLNLQKGAVVTSGDYQRFFTLEGKNWHHIIDPETMYPGDRWRAVTIVCEDSGLGDALSTTLFLSSREDGQKLLEQYKAEAMWISKDGSELFSPGFQALIKD